MEDPDFIPEPCPVTSCTAPRKLIRLQCTMPHHHALTPHEIRVEVKGLGLAPRLETGSITYSPQLRAISPAVGSVGGGTELILSGDGLSDRLGDIAVSVGGAPCRVLSTNVSQVTCVTAVAAGVQPDPAAQLVVSVRGQPAICMLGAQPCGYVNCTSSCTFAYDSQRTPSLFAANTIGVTADGKWRIALSGLRFASALASNVVRIGQTPCMPTALLPGAALIDGVSADLLNCDSAPPNAGLQRVTLSNDWGNALGVPSLPLLEGGSLSVSSSSPREASTTGGAELTLSGGGFSASTTIEACGVPCPITSLDGSELKCSLPSLLDMTTFGLQSTKLTNVTATGETSAGVIVQAASVASAALSEAASWFTMAGLDVTGSAWADSSGNAPPAQITGTGAVVKTQSGHGAAEEVTALHGGTSTKVDFGSDPLPQGSFAICSATRYTGANKARVLQAKGLNWLHGHWNGYAGVAYYDDWVTAATGSKNVDPNTDWVVMCGTSDGRGGEANVFLARSDGTTVRVDTGSSSTDATTKGSTGLAINTGSASREVSDFAIAEVITWHRELSVTELKEVAKDIAGRVLGAKREPRPTLYQLGQGKTLGLSFTTLHAANFPRGSSLQNAVLHVHPHSSFPGTLKVEVRAALSCDGLTNSTSSSGELASPPVVWDVLPWGVGYAADKSPDLASLLEPLLSSRPLGGACSPVLLLSALEGTGTRSLYGAPAELAPALNLSFTTPSTAEQLTWTEDRNCTITVSAPKAAPPDSGSCTRRDAASGRETDAGGSCPQLAFEAISATDSTRCQLNVNGVDLIKSSGLDRSHVATRGVCVALIDVPSKPRAACFDTTTLDGTEQLVTWIGQLPPGAPVMLASCSRMSWAHNVAEVGTAIKRLGGLDPPTQLDDAYALVNKRLENSAARRCESFCEDHTAAWADKCAWTTDTCSGCQSCTPPPPHGEARTPCCPQAERDSQYGVCKVCSQAPAWALSTLACGAPVTSADSVLGSGYKGQFGSQPYVDTLRGLASAAPDKAAEASAATDPITALQGSDDDELDAAVDSSLTAGARYGSLLATDGDSDTYWLAEGQPDAALTVDLAELSHVRSVAFDWKYAARSVLVLASASAQADDWELVGSAHLAQTTTAELAWYEGSRYWIVDACGDGDEKGSRCALPASDTAAIRCCANEANTCLDAVCPKAHHDDYLEPITLGSAIGDDVSIGAAARECAAQGGRLCTEMETTNGVCCGTGCGYDASYVWTSSECAPLPHVAPEALYSLPLNLTGVPVLARRLRVYFADAVHKSAAGLPRFGVRELIVDSCVQPREAVVMDSALSLVAAAAPLVRAISPVRGSTAGGTAVTISVDNLGPSGASVTVTIAGVACAVESVDRSAGKVSCVTGTYGPTSIAKPGEGPIYVLVEGRGAAVVDAGVKYEYIDLWSSKTTWGGSNPPVVGDTVWIPVGQRVLLDVSPPRLYMLVVQGSLIFDRVNLELTCNYIFVMEGSFVVGTEAEPFMQKAVITMHGSPVSKEIPLYGAKVLGCRSCTLDLHGAPVLRTWTKLNLTAHSGDYELHLREPVDWAADSQIFVTSTALNGTFEEGETATVRRVDNDGYTLVLESPLIWPHLGETRPLDGGHNIEFRAEVGLLTRNVVFQGNSPFSQLDRHGAHIMAHSKGHESLTARIENIEARYVGQAFRLGRYPMHLHMIGSVRNSYIKRNSIHHTCVSWNRWGGRVLTLASHTRPRWALA